MPKASKRPRTEIPDQTPREEAVELILDPRVLLETRSQIADQIIGCRRTKITKQDVEGESVLSAVVHRSINH